MRTANAWLDNMDNQEVELKLSTSHEENTPALPPNIGIFSIDFFKQWL
jgi:hypothetical protein